MENVCDSVENHLYLLDNKDLEPISDYLDYFVTVRGIITSLIDTFDLFHVCAFLLANMFVSNEGVNYS